MTKDIHTPNPVDIHVGHRVRLCRQMGEISQGALAEALGLTLQQVQKYESGANRVSASKLFTIAQFLGKPVAWFFEGLGDQAADEDGDFELAVRGLINSVAGRDLIMSAYLLEPMDLRRLVEIADLLRRGRQNFAPLAKIAARLRGEWHDPAGDLESDIAGVLREAGAYE